VGPGATRGALEALVLPHFLRHAHGTHALRRGADRAAVRETLGYASLTTTGVADDHLRR
jgi:integrase/recombinase XerD